MGNVKFEEEFILNSTGSKLYTCRWLPTNQSPKALVFLCHGYGMECSITMDDTGNRLARAGFAAYGIDYEGHGKSFGMNGYVPNFDRVVDDCSNHFTEICGRRENRGKRRFLLGESMGGAVIILLHRKKPEFWDGAVLVAPMCKIADEVRPGPFTTTFLNQLSKLLPTWKLIPTADIIELAFRDPEKRKQVRANPYCYKGKPRLKTGSELLRISSFIEQHLTEVSVPLLVLHGGDDKVTDIKVSELLCRVASSKDKTFKRYDGMWHSLIYGELEENLDVVSADIVEWFHKRCGADDVAMEREQKLVNDVSRIK